MRTYAGFGWTGLFVVLLTACGGSSDDSVGPQDQGSSGGDNSGSGGASTGVAGTSATGGGVVVGGSGSTGAGGASQGAGGNAMSGAGGSNGSGGSTGKGGSGGTIGQGGSGQGGSTGAGGTPVVTTEPPHCGAPNTPTGMPTLTPGMWTNITPPGVEVASTYGFSRMSIDPCNPYTIYVAADQRGIFRTTNGGGTWGRLGTPPAQPDYGPNVSYLDSPLDVKIDPKDNLHLYAVQGVRGVTLGFWVSKDGGMTWTKSAAWLDGEKNTWTNDGYWLAVDPTDFNHVLVTFHSPWKNSGSSGVVETKDGGATFTPYNPGGWAAGLAVSFLFNPEKGLGDSKTWLVGTQGGGGYYRTSDGGATWKNVTDHGMMHGGTDVFYASTGVLYSGSNYQIMRSTDNGVTWALVGPKFNDGFYKIIGDGKTLYAQDANTGGNSYGKGLPYITSPETDGLTWTESGTQTFSDGPFDMEFDAKNRILYSSNWRAGVWAMKVP
jgi:photosystem II stability/assembly factor-like uncharacterized protein